FVCSPCELPFTPSKPVGALRSQKECKEYDSLRSLSEHSAVEARSQATRAVIGNRDATVAQDGSVGQGHPGFVFSPRTTGRSAASLNVFPLPTFETAFRLGMDLAVSICEAVGLSATVL